MASPTALVSITIEFTNVAVTAFVITNELAVIFCAILTLLVPAVEEIVIAPRRVPPPTAPVNVMAPVEPEFKVNACVPSNVELKEIAAPFEFITLVPVIRTGNGKVSGFAPVTVILPPICI